MTITAAAEGLFVRKSIKGIKNKGQYRGAGFIEVSEHGIAISGKHVYRPRTRILIELGLSIGLAVITLGLFAPGVLLLFFITEYVWLENGNQFVSFDRVEAYNVLPRKALIAIQFRGKSWETPLVMEAPDWQLIYDALYTYIPKARISSQSSQKDAAKIYSVIHAKAKFSQVLESVLQGEEVIITKRNKPAVKISAENVISAKNVAKMYSVADAKAEFPQIVESVLQGEEVIITNTGKPAFKISIYNPQLKTKYWAEY